MNLSPSWQWLTVHDKAIDWGGPVGVPFDPFAFSLIDRPISERFDQVAARYEEKTAIDDGELSFTYGEISRASYALALSIVANVKPHGPIGIFLKSPAFFPIAALACLRTGHPIVPIDPRQPFERNTLIGYEAGLVAIVYDGVESTEDVLFTNLPWLRVTTGHQAKPTGAVDASQAGVATFILYTSGSSGRPKGICNSQSAILQRVAQFTNACHLNANDRFVLLSSTGTIAGIRDIFAALLNGATVIIAEPGRVGLDGVLRTMERGQVTVCYAVPALLRSLCRLQEAASAFRYLRILRLGGDIVLENDIALCRGTAPGDCHILIGYGSTEAPTVFQWFVPPDWSDNGSGVPCGRLLPDVSIALVDESGRSCGLGAVGELLVRSRHLALGYWQNGRLQKDFENSETCPFLRSGDRVRLREDGLAELVGRSSRLIKIKGHRIDPGEIESLMRESQLVSDAAIVARSKEGNASSLDLFVVPRVPSAPPRIEELRSILAQRLPTYMIPHRICIIDSIPLLPGFKPDYAALASLQDEQPATPRPDLAAQTASNDRVSQAVRAAWSKLVGQESFERLDAWEDSGGDSLKAMELVLTIEKAVGINVPLEFIDQDTTPSKLIAALHQLQSNTPQSDELRLPPGQAPLVFLCPGVGGDEPALARLRAEFGNRVRFVTIRYISSSAMFDTKARFDAIAETIVGQIRNVIGRDEVFHIAGYSFGGFVAWEVAHRLLAGGFNLGAVGLIDARRTRRTAGAIQGKRVYAEASDRHLSQFLPLRSLRFLQKLADQLPDQLSKRLPQNYDRELRTRALNSYKPPMLNHIATLFRSTVGIERSPDHGWRQFCPVLEIVPIDGTHSSILGPLRRGILAKRMLEMILAAESLADMKRKKHDVVN